MAKNHNYKKLTSGIDFTLEVANDGLTADMIGQGAIKPGDYITISDQYKYQVVEVEYYSTPPDMWRANLSFVPQDLPQIQDIRADWLTKLLSPLNRLFTSPSFDLIFALRRMAEINGEPILGYLQAQSEFVGLWVRRLFAPRCLVHLLVRIDHIQRLGKVFQILPSRVTRPN